MHCVYVGFLCVCVPCRAFEQCNTLLYCMLLQLGTQGRRRGEPSFPTLGTGAPTDCGGEWEGAVDEWDMGQRSG